MANAIHVYIIRAKLAFPLLIRHDVHKFFLLLQIERCSSNRIVVSWMLPNSAVSSFKSSTRI